MFSREHELVQRVHTWKRHWREEDYFLLTLLSQRSMIISTFGTRRQHAAGHRLAMLPVLAALPTRSKFYFAIRAQDFRLCTACLIILCALEGTSGTRANVLALSAPLKVYGRWPKKNNYPISGAINPQLLASCLRTTSQLTPSIDTFSPE